LGGAFGLTNLPLDVGRISGEAAPSDKNDELTRNNPTYRVELKLTFDSSVQVNVTQKVVKADATQFSITFLGLMTCN